MASSSAKTAVAAKTTKRVLQAVRRPARPARLPRPDVSPAIALAAAALSARSRRQAADRRLRRPGPDSRPGQPGRLHRLRPGERRQLPALDAPRREQGQGSVPAGQPADAVRAGQALRRMARDRLRLLELPRRLEGLAQARRLQPGEVALRPRRRRQAGVRAARGPMGHRRRHPAARRLLPRQPRVGGRHPGGDLQHRRGLCLGDRARRLGRAAARRRAGRGRRGAHEELPSIGPIRDKKSAGGHAFALVGFNERGFIVQNSWNTVWGASGFAVLPYEDWVANATDAWACALGVPVALRAPRSAQAVPLAATSSRVGHGRSLTGLQRDAREPDNPSNDPWPIDHHFNYKPYQPWTTDAAYRAHARHRQRRRAGDHRLHPRRERQGRTGRGDRSHPAAGMARQARRQDAEARRLRPRRAEQRGRVDQADPRPRPVLRRQRGLPGLPLPGRPGRARRSPT